MHKEIIGDCTLYRADCLEVMAALPDKSIDLVFTDPPYGIGIEKMNFTKEQNHGVCQRTNYEGCFEDKKLSEKYFSEMMRISKNQIIWGGNYYAHFLHETSGWIVWNKKGDGRFCNDFADGEMAWTSFKKPLKIYHYLWSGMVQEDMKNKEKRYHPAQKPVVLMTEILRDYTASGDTIFDGFMGSGTLGLSALNCGCKYIGVETDPKYYEIARERISTDVKQGRLF